MLVIRYETKTSTFRIAATEDEADFLGYIVEKSERESKQGERPYLQLYEDTQKATQ